MQARYTDAVNTRTSVEKQMLGTQTQLDELRTTHAQCTELIKDHEGIHTSMLSVFPEPQGSYPHRDVEAELTWLADFVLR